MAVVHNIITIPFSEMSAPNRSPQERIEEDGMHATQYLKCAWADRLTLADQLRTEWEVTIGPIAYVVGHEYPHYTGSFVTSVSIEGWGTPAANVGDASLMQYQEAVLTVQYDPKPFSFDGVGGGDSSGSPEIVYEEEFGFGAEFLPVERTGLFWDSANTAAQALTPTESPGIMVRFNTWTISFETKDSLPSSIHTLIGMVNNAQVTAATSGIVYPAETLLYAGPRITHRKLSDGSNIFSVSLTFNDKPDGWNKFRKRATVAPQDIYSGVATLFKPYVPDDFSTLGA